MFQLAVRHGLLFLHLSKHIVIHKYTNTNVKICMSDMAYILQKQLEKTTYLILEKEGIEQNNLKYKRRDRGK